MHISLTFMRLVNDGNSRRGERLVPANLVVNEALEWTGNCFLLGEYNIAGQDKRRLLVEYLTVECLFMIISTISMEC